MKNYLSFLIFLICTIHFGVSTCQAQTIKRDSLSVSIISPSFQLDSANSIKLYDGITAIINEALDSAAFPGCQILLAITNQTFYYQSFGYHTYDSISPVKNSDLYDLASITKTAATTLALMKLYDEDKLDLDKTLSYYFDFLNKSNKSNLTIRKVLAHQSRMKNWIPYYAESTRKNGKYKWKTMSNDSSKNYPNRIPGSDLFLHKDYKEKKIYKMIKKSKLYESEGYVYSGLAFYLFPMLIEALSGQTFEEYLNQSFYTPMGATTLTFDPLDKFPKSRIVPTEMDSFFRMKPLHGVVHDEGAAMMLGVSGNAGLFSNAADVAKIYQMLLNEGEFAGTRYLKPETVKTFTACQYCEEDNRRGLGFDKPLIAYDSIKSSVAKATSPNSFGHTGYTGTMIWADPDNGLLFVFLSNRVHPTRDNAKIYQMNIRPRIHELVYDLID
jgi:CubicO group peptidase (beta-lactamase class C family)